MSELATTKMSSRGQVVIPESIRRRLGLRPGSRFVVVGDRGVVMLKTIAPPSIKEFDGLVAQARKSARAAGLKPADIRRAVRRARKSA